MNGYIPDLKGIDAETFLENLNRDITPDEIREVREWALNKRIGSD